MSLHDQSAGADSARRGFPTRLWDWAKGLDFIATLVTRLISMAVSFGVSLVALRLIAGPHGAAGYAAYATVLSLLTALPFADLGLSAGIINATSDLKAKLISREVYVAVLRRSLTVMMSVSIAVVSASGLLFATHGWRLLLGPLSKLPYANLSASLVLIIVGISIPIGAGARILQGMGRVVVPTRWGLVVGPLQLSSVLVLFGLGAPASMYAVGGALAIAVVNVGVAGSAMRELLPVLRDSGSVNTNSSARYFSGAAPYVITLISGAAAFQIDRPILVHVSNAGEVAKYSLVSQFAIPAISVVVLSSQNLWPVYRQAQARGALKGRTLVGHSVGFAVVGLIFGAVIAAFLLAFSSDVSGNKVHVGLQPVLWSVGYLIGASACRPVAMLLNDTAGLWVQAWWGMVAAIVSVSFTFYLGSMIGASGAFAGSAVAVVLCQLIPMSFRARGVLAGGMDRHACV